jgi:hypothetical protein
MLWLRIGVSVNLLWSTLTHYDSGQHSHTTTAVIRVVQSVTAFCLGYELVDLGF